MPLGEAATEKYSEIASSATILLKKGRIFIKETKMITNAFEFDAKIDSDWSLIPISFCNFSFFFFRVGSCGSW